MGISAPLGQSPYAFHGTYEDALASVPFTVALNDLYFPVDLREYRRASQEALRDTVAQSSEANDILFNANGAWSRYRRDWTHGAGQRIADLGSEFNPQRFVASRGIDPWTDGELSLLPTVTRKIAETVVGTHRLVATDDYLWYARGTTLSRSSDPFAGSFTTLTISGTPTINDMTTDGVTVYIATSAGVFTASDASASTATLVATGNWTKIGFVANRLIGAKGRDLYEIASGGTIGSAILSHFQSTFTWTAIFAIGSRIYVGGHAGTRSELYTMSVTSAGALAVAQEAAPFPPGELLRSAASYAGIVMLVSSRGARFAILSGDATLTYGPLIDAVGDCRCVTFEDNFAWVGWSAMVDGGAGLARLRLDQFVTALQPAWAADLIADGVNGRVVQAVARFAGRTVFAVENQGLYVQTDSPRASGWIDSGEVYFGTIEPKILAEIRTVLGRCTTGHSVSVAVEDQSGTVVGAGTRSGAGELSLTANLADDPVEWVRVELTLATTTTTGPTVRSWRARAVPTPPAVQQWVVPLILHQAVVVGEGEGQIERRDPGADRQRVIDWWQTKETIQFQEGDVFYRVRVDAYEFQPAKWADDGRELEGTLTVRLVNV